MFISSLFLWSIFLECKWWSSSFCVVDGTGLYVGTEYWILAPWDRGPIWVVSRRGTRPRAYLVLYGRRFQLVFSLHLLFITVVPVPGTPDGVIGKKKKGKSYVKYKVSYGLVWYWSTTGVHYD